MLDTTTHVIKFADANTTPDSDELANLGPGCYVEVKDGNNKYWAEIQAINNESITGLIHYELENSIDESVDKTRPTSEFNKDQIVNLGCDNYCFC